MHFRIVIVADVPSDTAGATVDEYVHKLPGRLETLQGIENPIVRKPAGYPREVEIGLDIDGASDVDEAYDLAVRAIRSALITEGCRLVGSLRFVASTQRTAPIPALCP